MISHGFLLVIRKTTHTQFLLCSLCQKTQSRPKRCAIGKAITGSAIKFYMHELMMISIEGSEPDLFPSEKACDIWASGETTESL